MQAAIPNDVQEILNTLTGAGCSAWCVGGCVRDTLLGREPDDWDVTTSARPEEVQTLFGSRAFPTGLQHGTVTVKTGEQAVEVTTYRCDGTYADHRHPDSVAFSDTLEEDLCRRDFTVNALAMDASGNLRDLFGGQADLHAGLLRCVGDPEKRFEEDALRILRCLRFSAVLGFAIEEETAAAIHRKKELLTLIAVERIRVEFLKLLCGQNAAAILREYTDVLGVFLPELLPAVGFDQRNRHHCYDVWEHTIHAVEAVRAEPIERMVMLLHDLGKPGTFTVDAEGNGHFFGHPVKSGAIASEVLHRLKFDSSSAAVIEVLVERHDRPILPEEKSVRRALRQLGEENLRRLLEVKRADNLAQSPEYLGRQTDYDRVEAILDALLAQDACFSLKQLAVHGDDLTAMGLRGKEVGQTLNRLLDAVVDGTLPNERVELMNAARKMKGNLS